MSAKRWRLALALLGLLAVGLHLGTCNNALTYDDHFAIEQNPLVHEPWDVRAHLTSDFWGLEDEERIAAWRPLVTLSFAWNHAVHGFSPAGYHAVNLILHGLCTVLLAVLACMLGTPRPCAFAAAALFAVHPLHVEPITSGVGRADLAMTAALLGATVLWERRRTAAAVALFAGGLLCKEMAVMWLPVLVWRDIASGRDWRRGLWPLGVAGLWLVLRAHALGSLAGSEPSFLENPLVHAGVASRLFTAGEACVRALELFVAPATLLYDYSYATFPAVTSLTPRAAVGLLVLVGAVLATLATAKRAPAASSALTLWLAPYLLVSHLGPTLPMIFAERVLYLPTVGLCLLAGLGLARLATRPRAQRAAAAALVAAGLALALRSADRVGDWKDDATLHLHDVRDAPRGIKPIVNAAVALHRRGDLPAALAMIETAFLVTDDSAYAHVTAANLFTEAGDPERAVHHLQRAAALRALPDRLLTARCGYVARFDPARGVEICRAATQARGDSVDAWMFLAISHAIAGDAAAADRAFVQALAVEREHVFTLPLNYGLFLYRQGRLTEAHALLEQAARRAPGDAEVERALAEVARAAGAQSRP
jgi:Tfp pilus assembly protein PilF